MVISLSPSDMLLAAMAGCMRNIENLSAGRKDAYSAAGKSGLGDFQMHILGCMGELVVSRFLGLPWHGKGVFRGPDVGSNIGVRTTERDGDSVLLALHDADPDEFLFYCVRRFKRSNRFEVFEPILGAAGKRAEFWRSDMPVPAYFVPVRPITQ
jgi:hypothetical protein